MPALAMIALAMKLANWCAMMRNAPTQVRTQPIIVTVLRQSGVQALWTLRM